MIAHKIDEEKKIAKLYNENGEYVGKATIHLKERNGKKCIIIEADNTINPARYVSSIFNYLKHILVQERNINVYLDLSNYYGTNNSSWLYEWIFKITNNQLTEVDFVRIDKWSDISNKNDYLTLQDYLYEKFLTPNEY